MSIGSRATVFELEFTVKFVDGYNICNPPPPKVVYATDRSKAVVSVLFLSCVALGASYFKVFPCSLSSCFVIPFSIVITSLEEEGRGLFAFRAFFFLCFVLYVLVFVIFLFLLVSRVAAVCDCGTPWTFLLTFLT